MKDKKRMLIPDNGWDIGAVESWLEDQAAEGWHLTECWGRRARFQREEPKRVRYRLMPFPDEFMQSKVEREALYADLGWRFVANRWDYQVYVCEDPAAAELETDPVAASWAWDRLLRKQRRHMLLAWIFLLTAVIWIARSILTAEYPVRFLMRSAVATGSLVLMTVWMAYWTVSDFRGIQRTHRQMAAGLPRAHSGNWKKRRRQAILTVGSLSLLYLIQLLYPLSQLGTSWGADLEELDQPIPCLMGWQVDETLTQADRTSGVCLMNPTFLTPGHYDVWDYYPGERKLINQGDVLLLSFLAEPLYREWQERIRDYAEGNVIELDDPGFDGVSLGRRGEDTFLVLWQGRVVLYVGAFGVTGVEKHLDEYADVLAQFQ